MESTQTSEKIKKLSVAESILLVVEISDIIAAEQESLELIEAQRHELDRRLDADHECPELGSSWEEIKQRITAQE